MGKITLEELNHEIYNPNQREYYQMFDFDSIPMKFICNLPRYGYYDFKISALPIIYANWGDYPRPIGSFNKYGYNIKVLMDKYGNISFEYIFKDGDE